MPWFSESTPVDHASLEQLRATAVRAAAALEAVGNERLRSLARNLMRCAGPFADELAERTLARVREEARLAAACRRLAALASAAAAEALDESARREQLRDAYQAELERDRQVAANAAARPRSLLVAGFGTASQ